MSVDEQYPNETPKQQMERHRDALKNEYHPSIWISKPLPEYPNGVAGVLDNILKGDKHAPIEIRAHYFSSGKSVLIVLSEGEFNIL